MQGWGPGSRARLALMVLALALALGLAACQTPPPKPPVVAAPVAAPLPPVAAVMPPPKPPARPPRLGLALGGGAARGFAHIGVIQVLQEHGIRPALVVGTSAGSLVAAMYASGMSGSSSARSPTPWTRARSPTGPSPAAA